jgi:hypothetical protein
MKEYIRVEAGVLYCSQIIFIFKIRRMAALDVLNQMAVHLSRPKKHKPSLDRHHDTNVPDMNLRLRLGLLYTEQI